MQDTGYVAIAGERCLMALWEGQAGPGGVHVLIIGVGEYERNPDATLPGAAYTATRLALWWANAQDNLLPGQHLASIEVLISSPASVLVPMPDGGYPVATVPTRAAVCDAFEGWCRRGESGALAIVHWIGHGTVIGDGAADVHTLYCHDLEPCGTRQTGIEWRETLAEINVRLGSKALCFIDTCREQPDRAGDRVRYNPVWLRGRLGGAPQAYVHYAAEIGETAFAIDEFGADETFATITAALNALRRDRCKTRGGALFSEALLCALDGAGAINDNSEYGAALYAERIQDVVVHRLNLWKKVDPEKLRDLDLKPSTDYPMPHWDERAVLRCSRPTSTVIAKLDDPAAFSPGLAVKVDGTVYPHLCRSPDCWYLDIDHGAHGMSVDVPKAVSPDRVFAENFLAVHLEHKVTLKEKAA